MQHFFKDYTSVPYVETIKIEEEKDRFKKEEKRLRNSGNIKWKTYGYLDEELDLVELEF